MVGFSKIFMLDHTAIKFFGDSSKPFRERLEERMKRELLLVSMSPDFASTVKELHKTKRLNHDEAIENLALYVLAYEMAVAQFLDHVEWADDRMFLQKVELDEAEGFLKKMVRFSQTYSEKTSKWVMEKVNRRTSEIGKHAADVRHKTTNDKKKEIQEIWATGVYSDRDLCANQEAEPLGLAYSTSRRALQNTPNPDPWPGKLAKETALKKTKHW